MLTNVMNLNLKISNKCKGEKEDSSMKPCCKLTGTYLDKPNYVVHFKMLKFYLQHGMKILDIHQFIIFRQEAIYEPFVTLNTSRRKVSNKNSIAVITSKK